MAEDNKETAVPPDGKAATSQLHVSAATDASAAHRLAAINLSEADDVPPEAHALDAEDATELWAYCVQRLRSRDDESSKHYK
jgi:hypothetical protein